MPSVDTRSIGRNHSAHAQPTRRWGTASNQSLLRDSGVSVEMQQGDAAVDIACEAENSDQRPRDPFRGIWPMADGR
eukprot:5000229-Prymnesium_polylepis.1